MDYPIESIKALDGRIWATLNEEENKVSAVLKSDTGKVV